jgi:hypothetical protein
MARAATLQPERPVTRADIEAKLREIRGEVDTTATEAKSYAMTVGIVAAVVLIGGAYLLGRRRGRRRSTVVEIRRV